MLGFAHIQATRKQILSWFGSTVQPRRYEPWTGSDDPDGMTSYVYDIPRISGTLELGRPGIPGTLEIGEQAGVVTVVEVEWSLFSELVREDNALYLHSMNSEAGRTGA